MEQTREGKRGRRLLSSPVVDWSAGARAAHYLSAQRVQLTSPGSFKSNAIQDHNPMNYPNTIVSKARQASSSKLFLVTGLVISMAMLAACNKSPDSSVSFGNVVTAAEVDSNNAPTALADTFSTQQKAIYVVAEAKDIAPGTRLSANWSREGTPVQVSNEVTASQGYHNSNIEFHMNPGAGGWTPGSYTVQIMVNGKPGPQAKFSIK